ncbi:hypothetical protein [Roseimarinus sediminis]|uniref:hypothetical protein n=1 Tax=Roseimarinus sediminis TaxID=1610899 RepID=UPI003D205D58
MSIKAVINPFEKIAGAKSLFIGMAAVMVAGIMGYLSKTHFDGILNVHSGMQSEWFVHIAEPMLSIAVIALWFLLFAIIFGKQNVRAIDVVGTQFFAFIPLVPASLLGFFEVTEVISQALQQFVADPTGRLEVSDAQMVSFIGLMIIVLLLTVWSAVWIYNGFKVAANLPRPVHIPVYISGLIVGMLVPKLLISIMI